MIKYHGCPLSGTNTDAARFFNNRHAMISFWRPDQMPIIIDVCASFALDNGAFSAWRQGISIDFDEYLKWARLYARHPGFAWALIPDVIDGEEWVNDAYLDCWPSDIEGVPIWHLHESLERLNRLAAGYSRVALGSSGKWKAPGTPAWWRRIAEAMAVLCDDAGRPRCQLHGLRMLNPAIFRHIPLSSGGSANAGINAGSKSRFGPYYPPSAHVRATVIADRIDCFNSAPVWKGPPA